jgi:hypothetical protein
VDRASIFIDGSNFYHSLKEAGKRVELHKTRAAKAYDLITACSACKIIDEALVKRCAR